MSFELKTNAKHRHFDGTMGFYAHQSKVCNHEMRFAVYLPPQAAERKVPALFFLSGLTCTEENFMTKANAQRFAAEHGIALIAPDTSPRNTGIEDEDKDWTYGSGAGYYINATQEPWSKHYQMYDYVQKELPQVIAANFNVDVENAGLFGHSMGGHGTLIMALRNPERFKSYSVFSPISNPSDVKIGDTAYRLYLGEDKSKWREYDTMHLLKEANNIPKVLIDQGTSDQFLKDDGLRTRELADYCKANDVPWDIRFREDYDHGYYFIATFIEDHIAYHARILNG